jgi:hypothetical protein
MLRFVSVVFLLGLIACSPPASEVKAVAPASPPVKITAFYASPPNPPLGEKTLVCYGVENASEVALDPPVEKVWPAISRCFDFTTSKPVKLKLTANGGNGSVTQALDIAPGAPRVQIVEVSINSVEVKRGEPVMVCVKAKNAAKLEIAPGEWRPEGRSQGFGCIEHHPISTTTYVVTATGVDGAVDTERVTARVK